ncbi:MAG: hypothetical protein AB7K09_14780 [Planctomycetota bacterium]
MTVPDKYRIWVVDASPEGFDLVKRSIGGNDWLTLQHFSSASAFLAEVGNAVMSPTMLPQIVLCDFFLGEDTGMEVFSQFNDLFMGMEDYKPYFITFSSVPRANQTMVENGAPWELLKEKEADTSGVLKEFFASKEKVAAHLGHS